VEQRKGRVNVTNEKEIEMKKESGAKARLTITVI
jgi:hypothetical protein